MAQFWRKTEIVNDTGVFQSFPDLFIGQQDTMDVQGGVTGRRAILEYKVAESPNFGDAKLTAVRPNFYINSFNLNNSTELPRYKGYVFGHQLSDLSSPEGDLALKDESSVVIHSVMDGSGSWLEEKFDSTPRQIKNNTVRLEVQSGTVTRILDEAIFVEDLVGWLLDTEGITGGEGDDSRAWWNPAKYGPIDMAEYSDDFDAQIDKGRESLTQWLVTNFAIPSENATGFNQISGFDTSGVLLAGTGGAIAGAIAGTAGGIFAPVTIPVGVAVGTITATAGALATTDHDQYVKQGSAFTSTGSNWIIPLMHNQKSGKKDTYEPKKQKSGKWWVLSGKIDDLIKRDVELITDSESTTDEKLRLHPGNTVFDTVRRQKNHWIADPESYDEIIEAVYTTALFTTSAGFDGQGAELKTHWRNIDSAEVAEKGLMIPMSAKDGETINNRQELMLSYGHVPRPNERDVYHAGAYDVDAQGTESAVSTHDTFAGYESADETSRDTLIYEKMLDSKIATKVSFTTNLQDLEYAWAEARIGGDWATTGAARCPKNSQNGLISSRRGFFCTLSRNPVKNGKAGEQAQTFADYLVDNRTPVKDTNTNHTNIPGTYVLGFLNFPTDDTVTDSDPNNYDEGGAPIHADNDDTMGDLGYIHKQRQNKISVVWHDYWDVDYGEGDNNAPTRDTTMNHSIGWEINEDFDEKYQSIEGLDSKGFYDIRWLGMANGPWDQPQDRMVLLEPDTFYTVDMYMHPKVPFVRVHITDTATGKRVDGNKIQMWPGPYNVDSLLTIKAATVTSSGITTTTAITTTVNTQVSTSTGAHKWFTKGSSIYNSDGDVVATVKSSTKTLITFEGKASTTLSLGQTLYYWPGNHVNSRMGDESRWPAYCSFWLNNTPWETDNESSSAFQGFEVVDNFDFTERNGGTNTSTDTNRGQTSTCFHIDMFTGNTHKEGVHAESTVILDEFKIFNANTTKQYATISKNNTKSALGRLPVAAYSEAEALYRPIKNYLGAYGHYIQEPDSDAAPFDNTGLTNIILSDGGAGYETVAPTIAFAHGAGSGAKATATISGGVVTAVTITDPGEGYSGSPAVNFIGGSPTTSARARAYIGTSKLPTEIVKTIQIPRYTSIGFDTIPSDMYTLYGNCHSSGNSTTRVTGGDDVNSKSMMSFGNSGIVWNTSSGPSTNVHKAGAITLTQTNPQTAEFSSFTDNELIGGKLKIHYNTQRTGDAGSTTAVRDIVYAKNSTTLGTAYVEVWPPLPSIPGQSTDWEIQSRSSVLFNDLITTEINNVEALTTPDFDYARPDNNSTIGSGQDQKVTRGIFNIGWADTLSDITVGQSSGQIPAINTQSGMVTKDGFNDAYGSTADRTVTISGSGNAPKGGLECRYWDFNSGQGAAGDRRQGMRVATGTANTDAFVAPNGATKAIEVLRKYTDATYHQGPLGITRTFDTQVDLTDCDIMVVMRVPKQNESQGGTGGIVTTNMAQLDPETDAFANLQRLYGEPPTTSLVSADEKTVTGLGDGPEYACSLRLYSGSQAGGASAIGAWCLHKDNFMIKEESAIYKPSGAKSPANGYWIKLVFPTAGTPDLDKIKEFTFALNFSQHTTADGADWVTNTASGTGGTRMHIAGIHAIPRGTADVMAAFSNSENAVGELSKESFLSVDSGLHNRAKDGMHTTETGMSTGATKANPKITGLTVGGKGKLYTGYLVNEGSGLSTTATTINTDSMGSSFATLSAINLDDRISIGTSAEIMRVTELSLATRIVVERGADGTTATTHNDNDPIYVHTPSDADIVIKDYAYDVESFSQKGFANFGFSQNSGKLFNDSVTWQRRENPLAAARVIEVIGYSEEGVRVAIDQPDIFSCENNTNTTWCLYRETPRETGGTVINSFNHLSDLTTFTFKDTMLTENVLTIPKTDFLNDLPDDTSIKAPKKNYFISPYKYWMYLRYSPKARGNKGSNVIGARFSSTDSPSFPKRSYKSIVRTENYFKSTSSTQNVGTSAAGAALATASHYTLSAKDAGPTWNESVFNDGKYLNPWSMNFWGS